MKKYGRLPFTLTGEEIFNYDHKRAAEKAICTSLLLPFQPRARMEEINFLAFSRRLKISLNIYHTQLRMQNGATAYGETRINPFCRRCPFS